MYTDRAAIEGEIAQPDLNTALDDDGDGQADDGLLDTIIANVTAFIDGKLANIYDVPLNPVPPKVAAWALSIACYRIYRRRLTPEEKNNFSDENRAAMRELIAVSEGTQSLDLTTTRAFPPGYVAGGPVSIDCNTL